MPTVQSFMWLEFDINQVEDRDCGAESGGAGGTRPPPSPQYFQGYRVSMKKCLVPPPPPPQSQSCSAVSGRRQSVLPSDCMSLASYRVSATPHSNLSFCLLNRLIASHCRVNNKISFKDAMSPLRTALAYSNSS